MSYLEVIKEKLKGKKVCLYPMGIAAKSLLHKLEPYNIKIDVFSDKNSEYWGST